MTNTAQDLIAALSRAAWPAEGKEWGPEWNIQFHAGHAVALELLTAIRDSNPVEPIIEKWTKAARDGINLTPETRAQRNGGKAFKWMP
ncbi:hypothetical protein [Cereibacter azotoformans]|uniref:Uncharacterized protein n=1 Tax=Cereibacter azotoformans TaxID=43057 RepID=A0A2T5JIN4_9RHOB|nr:hypothetical protein [Cereibacter azotoformans]PTR05928.1 hypothetical protein C8J28_1553 [Cereibacter azotoformans]